MEDKYENPVPTVGSIYDPSPNSFQQHMVTTLPNLLELLVSINFFSERMCCKNYSGVDAQLSCLGSALPPQGRLSHPEITDGQYGSSLLSLNQVHVVL